MNYSQADKKLTGRCAKSRKVANHTYLVRRGNDIALQLHSTDVVTLHPDGSITLNSGGWQTVTTKARINGMFEYGTIPGWGYVHQRQGIWYMHDGSLFYDGVTIDADGKVVNPRPVTDYELRLKVLKKQISDYAKAFAANTKDIPLPGSGDCWGCIFTEGDDPTHRTEPMGLDHYFNHFEEGYFVPSLLGNAIMSKGYGKPGMIYHLCQTGTWYNTRKLVYDFLLKQLKPSLDRETEMAA